MYKTQTQTAFVVGIRVVFFPAVGTAAAAGNATSRVDVQKKIIIVVINNGWGVDFYAIKNSKHVNIYLVIFARRV